MIRFIPTYQVLLHNLLTIHLLVEFGTVYLLHEYTTSHIHTSSPIYTFCPKKPSLCSHSAHKLIPSCADVISKWRPAESDHWIRVWWVSHGVLISLTFTYCSCHQPRNLIRKLILCLRLRCTLYVSGTLLLGKAHVLYQGMTTRQPGQLSHRTPGSLLIIICFGP